MGLLQLPAEILLLIAEQCHHQPRVRRLLGPVWDPSGTEKVSGGLEWLSLVCRRLRSLVIPLMFTRLNIESDPGEFHAALAGLSDHSEILHAAQFVTLALQPDSEPGSFHEGAPTMALDVLRAMPRLEEIAIKIFDEGFMSAFLRQTENGGSPRLNRVKGLHWQHTLVDASHMASLCPNLERLSLDLGWWSAESDSDDIRDIVGPFAELPGLSLLVIEQTEPWTAEDIGGKF